jgi:hypothetical protein
MNRVAQNEMLPVILITIALRLLNLERFSFFPLRNSRGTVMQVQRFIEKKSPSRSALPEDEND